MSCSLDLRSCFVVFGGSTRVTLRTLDAKSSREDFEQADQIRSQLQEGYGALQALACGESATGVRPTPEVFLYVKEIT